MSFIKFELQYEFSCINYMILKHKYIYGHTTCFIIGIKKNSKCSENVEKALHKSKHFNKTLGNKPYTAGYSDRVYLVLDECNTTTILIGENVSRKNKILNS